MIALQRAMAAAKVGQASRLSYSAGILPAQRGLSDWQDATLYDGQAGRLSYFAYSP